jgi:protein-S-isoprenylcysteine O-methyltransferase Ste14
MNLRLRLTRLLLLPAGFLALATLPPYPDGSLVDTLVPAAGLVLLLVAAGGRIWASAYVVGRKNDVLVTEGPYSLVRNPLYFFSLLGFAGTGLAFGSLALGALLVLIFFATHWPSIRREEKALERLFGEAYGEYRARVPRFLPRIGRARSSGVVALDAERFRVALRECMAIPLVFVLADLLEWAKEAGALPVFFLLP